MSDLRFLFGQLSSHFVSEECLARLLDALGLGRCATNDEYPIIGIAKHLYCGLVFAFEAASLPGFIGSFVHFLVRNAGVLAVPFIKAMKVDIRQQR